MSPGTPLVYVNEMTAWWLTTAKRPNTRLEDWGFESCDTNLASWKRRRQWSSQPHLHNETSIKTLDMWVSFPGWQYSAYCHTSMYQEGNSVLSWLHREKTRTLSVRDHLRLQPTHLPLLLVSVVSFCYNKSVILSTALSWVLWVILVNYRAWGDHGNSWICSQ